jgi:hypothetical protein
MSIANDLSIFLFTCKAELVIGGVGVSSFDDVNVSFEHGGESCTLL